jgi:purine-binding chemotaxis protein CheW
MTPQTRSPGMEETRDFSREKGEIVLFMVSDILSGLNIRHVQEISRNPVITRVYRAPEYVRGVINLRGQVVTLVDMRIIFGLEPSLPHRDMRIIVVRWQGEPIGLLVDSVHDIVEVDLAALEPPPSNVRGVTGSLFSCIYKRPSALVALVDLDEALGAHKDSYAIRQKVER